MKNATTTDLQNEKLCLQETVESLQSGNEDVYDAIVNHVPTKNVPVFIQSLPNDLVSFLTKCYTEKP